MDAKDAGRMLTVAQLLYERDAAALAALKSRDTVLRAEIERLATGAAVESPDRSTVHRATLGIATERWHVWRKTRIASLQRDRAALAARLETARENAARALGRVGILEELAQRR